MTKRYNCNEVTVVVLEAPWDDEKFLAERSIEPFIRGLIDIYGARMVYRTFTTRQELENLLANGDAFDGRMKDILLYITAHGAGKRLLAKHKSNDGINISKIFTKLDKEFVKNISGVWLSTCENAQFKDILENPLVDGGANFSGGYSCNVGWTESLLIDMAVIAEWLNFKCRFSGPSTKDNLNSLFKQALSPFSPDWEISHDHTTIRNGLKISTRGLKGKSVAEDITPSLFEEVDDDR